MNIEDPGDRMFFTFRKVTAFSSMMFLSTFFTSQALAIDPRFELDPSLFDRKSGTSTQPTGESGTSTRKKAAEPAKQQQADSSKAKPVTVTTEAADKHIETSPVRKTPRKRTIVKSSRGTSVSSDSKESRSAAGYPVSMMSLSMKREMENIESVRQVWSTLIPAQARGYAPLDFESKNFSLSLDPSSFPSLPAADGGRIIVDSEGKIPPLVKALIQEKDPNVRFVTESPRNPKRFMSALLGSAHFYSVEENFSVDFGADPKLTVYADYKIEKDKDSLLRNDVTLLNVNDYRRAFPPSLVNFLRKEGFQAVEPPPSLLDRGVEERHRIVQISAKDSRGIVDSLLKAMTFNYESNRDVQLFDGDQSGIRLSVKAERYFENGGVRYVVSHFEGDPVNYTLMRLLETAGYRVVIVEPNDDFKRISEKLFSRMRIPGSYAAYNLWPTHDTPYGLQMSGIMFSDRNDRGGKVLITDKQLDPLMRDLAGYNGFAVIKQ